MTALLIGIGIGLAAGILSGLFGIGGGIIIVPALVALGLTQREASGTSLAALVAPVAIFGVIEYARRHEIRVPYAIGIGLGLAIGALLGARFAGKVSNLALQRGFGLLLLAAAARFLLFVK
ncbi:MAG TPA: TSUP family transporter [Actinomycetota bacterium]